MTLIAAWITPEFRIVASDSRLTNSDCRTTDEVCQKIFVSNHLTISLWGGFGLRFNEFKKDNLKSGIFKKEGWDENRFKIELTRYLGNEDIPENGKDLKSKILIIPSKGEIKVLIVTNNEFKKEYSFEEYKQRNQIKELGDLFFSEQILDNGKIDCEYQRKLLEHFNLLKKDLNGTDLNLPKLNSEPKEVKLIVLFLLDVMVESTSNPLYRCSIGGTKVFYSFCFDNDYWKFNEYSKFNEPLTFDEIVEGLND